MPCLALIQTLWTALSDHVMPCHAMPERNKTAQDCDTAGAIVMMQPAVRKKLTWDQLVVSAW